MGLMLAATFTLTNCAKEIDAPVQESESAGVPFELVASTVDTKTTNVDLNTVWAADDAINVFHAVAGTEDYKNDGSFVVTDVENGRFNGGLVETLVSGGSYDWYVMYPYSQYVEAPNGTDYSYVGRRSGLVQNGYNNKEHLAGSNCALYGVVKSVAADERPSVSMHHLTSVIAITINNGVEGTPLTVKEVAFTAPEDVVGSYYINFAGDEVNYLASDGFVSNVASITVEDGTALAYRDNATVYIPIKPFTAKEGDVLKIKVNDYEKELELGGDVEFVAGNIKPMNFLYDQDPVEVEPTTGIASIYETVTSTAQSTPDNIYVNLTDAVVTYVNGNNAYLEDATGGILIYKSGHGLVAGDKLTGVISGAAYIRYGVHQIVSFDLSDITKTEGAEIPSTTLTVDELLADYDSYVSRRIVIEGATVADAVSASDRNGVVNQNGTAINLYAGAANLVTFTYGTNVDFVCYPTYYNSTKQVSVWEDPTVNQVCAVPEITYENNLVSISCPTEDVTIYYTKDGNNPTTSSDIYSEPFEISATCIVKAYAVRADWQDSDIATLECVYSSEETMTETIELTATAQGYTNAQEVTSVSSDNVTINFNKGTNSNTPKYYNTGTAVRVYGGGYFVVESDKTIVKIVLTFGSSDGSNTLTTDVGAFVTPVWTGSASSVKFTVGGTSGHRRIQSVAVTYQAN